MLPVTNTAGDFNPLYLVATVDEPSNAIYPKVRFSVLSNMKRLTM